ncbi:MAG: PilZ domain-containing protein [Deltaproteobacteria bacterium]|nr:MAG: PilZ domain-containing protein [Deltaproteobacteria bacterium]
MDLQDIMRKYFRISVTGSEAISIKINNVPYDVVDVGDRGIGIRLGPEDIFVAVDDELPIELKIEDLVYNLQGKVVHISPEGPEEFLCGIEFINIDNDAREKLMDYLQSYREKIFKEE